MNEQQAQRLILVSLILTGAIGGGAKLIRYGQWPSSRYIVGLLVSFIGLSALAEWEPQVAAPLAGGLLSVTVLGEGNGFFGWFDTGETNATSKGAKPPPVRHRPAPKRLSMPTQHPVQTFQPLTP